MVRILFVNTAMFSYETDRKFVSWNMEPIIFAILKSLTPDDIDVDFVDERYKKITYSSDYDLAVFSLKTYNARNAYRVSENFRKLGVRTIAGGYHVILNPDEAKEHFDSVVLSSAESSWPEVIDDLRNNVLKDKYYGRNSSKAFAVPDRSIFNNYTYLPLRLVESSRGCPHRCNFCSTAEVYKGKMLFKDPKQLDFEFRELRNSIVLFTDENIAADKTRLLEIAEYAGKHNVKWISQADISISTDEKLLSKLASGGCRGLLIGFESISEETLRKYEKFQNLRRNYKDIIQKMHRYGIMIYAAFIFDTHEFDALNTTTDFILNNKLDLCGLHPLTPFPGTKLYEKKLETNKTVKDWWLHGTYPYFKYVFIDEYSEKMENAINRKRDYIFSIRGIIRRIDWRILIDNPGAIFMSILFNLFGITEVRGKASISKKWSTLIAIIPVPCHLFPESSILRVIILFILSSYHLFIWLIRNSFSSLLFLYLVPRT